MGLTIVHKSDLTTRKKNPRVALVLAGGAVTGGAYKLGGLKALDDFLVNRKTTDFDIYVGLSAGAFLAAPLAGGVTPPEMLRSLDGTSEDFTYLSPLDFYNPNLAEFTRKPLEFLVDLLTYVPSALYDFLAQTPELVRSLQEPLAQARRRPTLANLIECVKPVIDAVGAAREFPFPLAYLPSGLFDNASLERYLRHNIDRRGMTNDFRVLHRLRQVALYIVAMNLDTAERVVFGHDEDTALTISEAVQASTALPGFYKPARIKGVDYVDGGVRRTANIDVAIEHGAELVICYVPLRPFHNRVVRLSAREGPLRDRGAAAGEPGHAHRAQPGAAHAAALAPAARHPAVPGRPELPGRHHPARAGGDRPRLLQDGPAQPVGGPQRGGARLSLGHAGDRGALRDDPPDPADLRGAHDAQGSARGPRAPAAQRAERGARRRAPPRSAEAQPARRVAA